ncbi:uncharacterized protein LOC143859514 [Tasmannia lanceolata]|uniref:uncharacterized protein LOC143859514 n=1 Tax=Tasmannia lanceolata TaxID=3420 RepID=UPI0040627D3E
MALKGRMLPIELLDLRDEAQGTQPAEDLVSVPLCENDDEKVVQIGSSLDDGARCSVTQFLQDNADVFARAPTDMPGIKPEVSSHRLGVDPTCRPVKQKKRHFALERQMAIREEVERLLRADFIREIQYPDWLANVVLIRMYESDIPKTSFVTDQGTYCYRVMPFGLKNVGATYQRLVNKLFRNQIGRNMEVYVDDMLVKSLSSQDHVSDLEETFQVLRDNKMKLNPTKCTFGITEPEIAQAPAAKGAITAGEPAEDGARAGTIPLPPVEHDPSIAESLWEVHVDGSSNKAGCGAGLVLTGPDGFAVDYALRFGFRASNNEAEYEALLAGMNLVVQTGAQRLKAYCDSQLVANQIQGIYEGRDERMIKYLSQVRQLSSKFRSFEVVGIPRADNTKADVLSKLAASGYTTLVSKERLLR